TPALASGRVDLRVAEAWQVDEMKLRFALDLEPVDEPRAARRARRPREPVLADERVDQARLADVRSADDGDLRQRRCGKVGRRRGGDDKARGDLHRGCTGASGSNTLPRVDRMWHCAQTAARAAGVDRSTRPSARATGASRIRSSSAYAAPAPWQA